jgi:hypothetical protein
MHTGQNIIAPESSVPQAAQVRLGSVLMDLTVLQPQFEPKETRRSIEGCENGQHGFPANYRPVAQTIACCLIVARPTRFRNKNPIVNVLRVPS